MAPYLNILPNYTLSQNNTVAQKVSTANQFRAPGTSSVNQNRVLHEATALG